MTDTDQPEPTQAENILAYFPGETLLERRRALRKALRAEESKVRYWCEQGFFPQPIHQDIIDAAHREGVEIPPEAFVRHLRAPSKTPAASAVG